MTRRSKRELERAIADLDSSDPVSAGSTPRLEERYSEDVVDVVYQVARDLIRLKHELAAGAGPIGNEIDVYPEAVRDEFSIDDDRDDAVRRGLEDVTGVAGARNAVDAFAVGAVALAARSDVAHSDGTTLEEFVDDGRERRAEQLLVGAVYDLFAVAGGQPQEVSA